MKFKRSEGATQNAVCEYLQLRGGSFFWRQNTMATWDAKRGCHRTMPKFSVNGVSDLILVKKGMIYCIEIKSPDGKQSPSQKSFEENIVKNGGKYVLARGLDDVIKVGL